MIHSTTTRRSHQPRHADHGYLADEVVSFNEVQPALSFVIPLMNEEATLEELFAGIQKQASKYGHYEVIFIDDGSTDSSWEVVRGLAKLFPNNVRAMRFRSNRGKAAALQVGFEAARGKLIFTMDADLQDDANEIPRFIAKIEEGYDLVSGWKEVRHDPWHKVLPSRVFNRMLSHFSRVDLHDHNCGFKCYRREVAKNIRLFGVLLAAVLRAMKIPSRTVSGLVYAEEFLGEKGIFGYHMWTQAWIGQGAEGKWVDLDATLESTAGFDATHIALSTSAMADGEMFMDMVSMASVVGRLSIRVVESK